MVHADVVQAEVMQRENAGRSVSHHGGLVGSARSERQVAHLAAAPRLGLAVTDADGRPGRARTRHQSGSVGRICLRLANHRSPSRLSMTAGRMQARHDQRRAGHGAHLQVELRDIAGVDAVVAGVVRPRRHLVGERASRRPGRRTRRRARRRRRSIRRCASPGPRPAAAAAAAAPCAGTRVSREDAVAVDVLLHRQVHHLAGRIACDHDADLGHQRHALLQHASHAAEGRESLRPARP